MMMSAEPHVRAAPEPLRVDPVRTTELVCPDLDLSITLTPERPAGRRHRQQHASCDGQLTEGAGLNSTLALGAELQEVENQVFDLEKAVRAKLQSSCFTKHRISSKAAEGETIVASSQQAIYCVYCIVLSISSFPSLPLEAPDLLHFYSPDKMLRETPLLPGDRISMPRPRPVPRPAHTTLHLHHRHKLWES
uniref:Protein phosphatase 1 regulatory subunit 35 C-terminal domain-containing protein n=1 Tax=Cyprinus carpio carpio TaxID=630221 RepID=A0A9J8CK37_CYPCA